MATIKLKNGTGAPLASDLVQGEPALDLTNKRLYTEDAGGAIIEVGVNPTELNVTNNIVVGGTVDGRDIATDGTKLDTVETNADVTDTANVTAAGAVMDSELTSEASVKALNQGIATTDSPTFAALDVTGVVEATGYLAVEGTSGNTGAGTDRWIGGDGTAGTWFYNVPTGSNHYFAVNNANKLAIDSTGIDVTGTVTADGLTSDGNVSVVGAGNTRTIGFDFYGSSKYNFHVDGATDADKMFVRRGTTNVANFASNGDISFYDTAGTDAKFRWDASAESLGIGTDSPDTLMHLSANTGATLTLESTDTAIATNEVIGTIDFYSNDASGIGAASRGSISLIAEDAAGAGSMVFKTSNASTASTEAMRIDSSGNVGIGTADPTVASGNGLAIFDSTVPRVQLRNSTSGDTSSDGAGIFMSGSDLGIENRESSNIIFYNNTEKMRIDSSGNVGIGTTSPSAKLEVLATAPTYTNAGTVLWGGTTNNDNHTGISLSSSGDALNGSVGSNLYYSNSNSATQSNSNRSSGEIKFENTTTSSVTSTIKFGGYVKGSTTFNERMRIDSSGNVGIGTSSPSAKFGINASAPDFTMLQSDVVKFRSGVSNTTNGGVTGSASGDYFARTAGGKMLFSTNDGVTAHAVIDTSGNLLVGQTSADSNSVGIGLLSSGTAYAVRDGGAAFIAHRKSSDGNIVEFLKDNTTVGSVGTVSGDLYVGQDDTNLVFNAGGNQIIPAGASGANRDAQISLGDSGVRFKDLYLSGGAYLGGTGSANKLDDYEEGTWTPTFGSASFTCTGFASVSGTYTKIGNVVRAFFSISCTGTSGNFAVGDAIRIDGLPFSALKTAEGGTANASSDYLGNGRATWQSISITSTDRIYLGCHYVGGTNGRSSGIEGSIIYSV